MCTKIHYLGLVIAVVRGRLKEEEFGLAFQEGKFDIPKAPSLGLLLDDVRVGHFSSVEVN